MENGLGDESRDGSKEKAKKPEKVMVLSQKFNGE